MPCFTPGLILQTRLYSSQCFEKSRNQKFQLSHQIEMNNQVHQRTFATNGVGRRTRADTSHRSDAQSWRSPAHRPSPAAGPGHGYQNHPTSNSLSPTSSGRPSAEDEDSVHRGGTYDNRPLHDRLLFLTMCLIGQFVEVQVKNGSVYSGIFHTANAEKDFGVVLKMARLTKDGSVKGGKSDAVKEAARQPPLKTLIIHAKDFVQIIAKEVSLTGESLPNGRAKENKNELITDSLISQSRRDVERELKPWKPDTEAPKGLGLESTFQNSWNRSWDQFETNKALFGVETTFDEELYTTKLERGPQSREREREALRIAREIEGESTRNTHLAEERGVLDAELDNLDEESRYSSVIRHGVDDAGEDDDKAADNCNQETFGSGAPSSSESNVSTPTSLEAGVNATAMQGSASPSQVPTGRQSPLSSGSAADAGLQALNLNTSCAPVPEEVYRDFHEFKLQENAKKGKKHRDDQVNELKSFSESLKERTVKDFDGRLPKASSIAAKCLSADDVRPTEVKGVSDAASLTTNVPTIAAPPASALPIPVALSSSVSVPSSLGSHSRNPSISTATGSLDVHQGADAEPGPSASTPASSPTSSGSVSASTSAASSGTGIKKSLLNPNAKEFKLNPNAKAFTPSFSTPRPASPINQSPMYMPAGLHPVSPMQGMPVGLGMSQFMQQPAQPAQYAQYNNSMAVAGATVVSAAPYIQPSATFVPGAAVPPQGTIKLPPQTQPQVAGSPYAQQQTIRYLPPPAYPHPNGQLYPQQVMYGQPGPVVYIQQFPQGMMQGQPVPLQQGPLPPQPSSQLSQPHKHRGNEIP